MSALEQVDRPDAFAVMGKDSGDTKASNRIRDARIVEAMLQANGAPIICVEADLPKGRVSTTDRLWQLARELNYTGPLITKRISSETATEIPGIRHLAKTRVPRTESHGNRATRVACLTYEPHRAVVTRLAESYSDSRVSLYAQNTNPTVAINHLAELLTNTPENLDGFNFEAARTILKAGILTSEEWEAEESYAWGSTQLDKIPFGLAPVVKSTLANITRGTSLPIDKIYSYKYPRLWPIVRKVQKIVGTREKTSN